MVFSKYPSSHKSSPNQNERVQFIATPMVYSKFSPARFIGRSPCLKKRKIDEFKIDKINTLLKYAANVIEDEASDLDENANIVVPVMKGTRFIHDVNLNKHNKSKKFLMQMSKILKDGDKINDNLFFVERE
jgi:hypothetical protein